MASLSLSQRMFLTLIRAFSLGSFLQSSQQSYKHKVRSVSQLQLENVSRTMPTCNHIVILELFAKNQPLNRVVVCE